MSLDIVTVCTHDEGWFTALQESCKRRGAQLTVLGWGERWRGFSWRFNLMRSFLRDRPPDQLVAFVDAYDVLVLCNPTEIVRRFTEITSAAGPAVDIVLGIEDQVTSHIVNFLRGIAFRPCGDHIVNAGVYMGRAGRLLEMLALLPTEDTLDDQKLLNNACQGKHREFFRRHTTLDKESRLIFNATCDHLTGYIGSIRCRSAGLDPQKLVHPNGTVPCFLHCPGGIDMDPFCRVLGLPPGKPRPRTLWMITNYWPELLKCICTITIVVLCLALLIRHPRPTKGSL